MKKNRTDKPEEIKPDLKHDNMEFAAPADGDDPIDIYPDDDDDDGISAEELAEIENASGDEKANALNSVEADRVADDDVIFDENDVEEEYDDEL